jgi:capsular polysaccharide biosynthesis protein
LLTVFGSGDRVTAYERDLEDAICFDELYYLTSLHVPLRKSPTGVKAVRQCVGDAAARFGGSANFPTRLYISRTDANTRRLLNERDVIQFLEQRGFTTVSLEELDFLTKVRLFMNADIIIGAKGAGMTNIIFMKPASHAIILSPDDFPDPFHWDQAQHVGIEYCEIFGVSQENPLHGVGFKDFTIEIEQLELAISQICRGEKLIEFH